jgi:hypothetical protein
MRNNEAEAKFQEYDPLRVRHSEPQVFEPSSEALSEASSEPEVRPRCSFPLLDGEKILLHKGQKRADSISCNCLLNGSPLMAGQLTLTNYRLYIEPSDSQWCYQNRVRSNFFDIPLLLIQKVERMVDKTNMMLDISTKDGRFLRISISNAVQSEFNVYPTLYSGCFPQNSQNRFAFFHSFNGQVDGWKLYNPQNDYARLGVNESKADCKWKFINNSNGDICDTYPELLVVPKDLSLIAIKNCASFRSRNRFPVLVWCNTRRSATLWRCAQPKTGIRTSRCTEDEEYLRILAQSSQREPVLHIFDARPFVNAHAQRALGGGVENVNHYERTELHFLNIENIHVIRESWVGMIIGLNSVNPSKYLSAVEKSGWLEHLSLLLQGAVGIVESLQNGISCLIHCSDGWDRTSQLCSLVQICMDSHYRSLRGFAQVVEKDWVSFGHQFEVRLAHGNANLQDDKRSPIFLQFLDCVYQLTLQFPTHFEFNSNLLHDLTHFAFAGRFGTFMGNCVKDRALINLSSKTTSIWTYIFENLDQYTNPYYQAGQDDPVIPIYSIRKLSIWHELFSKWHSDHYYSVPQLLGPNDHKEALMRSAGEGMQLYKALIMQKDQELKELKKQLAELKEKT